MGSIDRIQNTVFPTVMIRKFWNLTLKDIHLTML